MLGSLSTAQPQNQGLATWSPARGLGKLVSAFAPSLAVLVKGGALPEADAKMGSGMPRK